MSLLVFRFIGGLAIGGSSVVAPMYIAEISPAAIRGRLVALSQFNVVAGILAAYFSNYVIAAMVGGPGVERWRWMLGIPAVPAALFFVFLLRIPESPRWLVKQHRREEAADVLRAGGQRRPRRPSSAEIAESLHEETVSADEPFFQRKYRKPILLAVMVAIVQPARRHQRADLLHARTSSRWPGRAAPARSLQSVVIGFTNLMFTMIAMTVIDRFGRKRLLLIGAVGTRRSAWASRPGRSTRGVGGTARAGQPARLHRVLRLLARVR